jgi:hypothetical protein
MLATNAPLALQCKLPNESASATIDQQKSCEYEGMMTYM